MKIGILEFYGHRSDVEYLSKVLSPNHKLFVIANKEIHDRLDKSKIDIFNVDSSSRKRIAQLVKAQQPDVLIACTITPDSTRWNKILNLKIPVVALVHNVNWQLSPKLIWKSPSLDSIARRIRWWLRGDIDNRLKLSKKFAGLVFPSPNIETYAKTFTDQLTLGIQWAIAPEKIASKSLGDPFTICLPGGVDFKFRNYRLVVQALQTCRKSLNFHVHFLGVSTLPRDKIELDKLLTTLPSNISYQTHDSFVPTEEYQQSLLSCDLILINHIGKVTFAEQVEFGGRTKVTGAENDQVRATKPALVSGKYYGMNHLAANQRYYENAQQLQQLLEQAAEMKWTFKISQHNTRAFQERAWSDFLARVLEQQKLEQ